VNNGSADIETCRYLKEIASKSEIETIEYPYEFNYSAINNYAVKYAKGEYLVFLNDDTEIISSDWLEKMIWWLQNDNVGCVGAKLLYPENTIQHIGVAIGVGTAAMHYYNGESMESHGYFNMNLFPREVSAVTAACLGMRKSTYLIIGGFDEGLPVAFNDVELCTRLRSLGYENVIDPGILLYHYESRSRGYDDNDLKHIRSLQERNYYIKKTKMDGRYDRYYARSLSIINPYCLSFPPRVLSRIAICEMSAKPCVVLLGSIRRQGDELRDTITEHAIKLRGMGYSAIVGVDAALSRTGDSPDFELVFNERDAADMIRRKLAKYVIIYSESFNRLMWFLPEEVEVFIFQSSGFRDSSDDAKAKWNDLERIPLEKYGTKISSIDEFILRTTG
jgi:GT2 family glycosyltransferase